VYNIKKLIKKDQQHNIKHNLYNNVMDAMRYSRFIEQYIDETGFNEELKESYHEHLIDYYFKRNIDIRELKYGTKSLISLADIYILT